MSEVFTPANIIVAAIVAAGLFFGVRRMVGGLMRGQGCCADGGGAARTERVKVTDTDEAHYPYATDLLIGGMSCEGCAANVENALNSVFGTWARVDLASKTAHVLSKRPIDADALEAAVKAAGYYVMHL